MQSSVCEPAGSRAESSTNFPPEPYTGLDIPNCKFYGRNCGPWSHSLQLDMKDAHQGRLFYESGHEDDGPVSIMFEADVMVDSTARIVQAYNLIHIQFIDHYPFDDAPVNWLKCGAESVKHASFRYFFDTDNSLESVMTFVTRQFFGTGWRHEFCPVSVVDHIKPVAVDKAMAVSRCYKEWTESLMPEQYHSECRWKSVMSPEFASYAHDLS